MKNKKIVLILGRQRNKFFRFFTELRLFDTVYRQTSVFYGGKGEGLEHKNN